MTNPGTGPPRKEDLAWCHEAVQGVSRTFAITIDCLDEPMASWICVGYLLCRVPDTIEDAGHISPTEQVRLLESYGAALDPDSEDSVEGFREEVEPWLPDESERNADWAVVAAAPRVVRTFEELDPEAKDAIRPPVEELVGGMARFVDRYAEAGGLRIETIEELEEYCWYAAGTVGTLITNLLATDATPARARQLRANARSFAMLLQLVNVAKDVAADYEGRTTSTCRRPGYGRPVSNPKQSPNPATPRRSPASSSGSPATPRATSTTPKTTSKPCPRSGATPSQRGRFPICSPSAPSGNSPSDRWTSFARAASRSAARRSGPSSAASPTALAAPRSGRSARRSPASPTTTSRFTTEARTDTKPTRSRRDTAERFYRAVLTAIDVPTAVASRFEE